jgi:diacylglycerol kinase (ATP)
MTERLRPNDREKVCFVVNPRSAGGGTSRRVDALVASASRYFVQHEVRLTESPGHATSLAAAAVDDGFDVVAAVGGDGTANEVVNGLFVDGRPRRPGVVFTVVPAGTGSDLVKTLGMPADLDAAVRIAAFGPDRAGDAVLASFTGPDGAPLHRVGVNVLGLGLSGDVVARANRSSKRFGGTLTFLGATLAGLAAWRPPVVSASWVDADGSRDSWEGPLFTIFLANGQYAGGGMWVGKGGSISDGAIDLTIVPALSLPRLATGLPRLYTGDVEAVPGVVRRRITSIEASCASEVLLDVDGEQPGRLPGRFEILQGALRIRGVWP